MRLALIERGKYRGCDGYLRGSIGAGDRHDSLTVHDEEVKQDMLLLRQCRCGSRAE